MGNIDEKRLSALLERINNIKVELEALENEVRRLGEATEAAEVTAGPTETPVAESVEALDIKDEIPIEIDIPDINIPPIVEDPAAEYTVASAGSATEDIPVPEPTSPVTEPVEVSIPTEVATTPEAPVIQPDDDLPSGDDLPMDEPSTIPEPVPEPTLDIEPEIVIAPAPESETTQKTEPAPRPKASILDSQKPETAVMDVMAEKQAWRTDRPGSQVKNVISAISLNDRVLLINVLFKEDPILFQNTISAFNGMTTLDEAISYIRTNFPDWDMNSEPVYRLMMAVRRKLR
uniref:hypothetical protein n=1 Tax=Candidatus Cryptobacteroides bacterium TaxID=3085639 RepID=UPI004028F6FE